MSRAQRIIAWPAFFKRGSTRDIDWPFFPNSELACKTTGHAEMHEPFMRLLVAYRLILGRALPVTSGFRSREHNRKVKGASNSAHLFGCAVDIATANLDVYQLVSLATDLGFTGIHVKNHGPRDKRFIHLDYITGADVPQALKDARPYIHTYPS